MKLFIKFIVIAALLIVTAVTVFIWTLDINQYKPLLEQTVSEHTGRQFTIAGDLDITPFLSPVITLHGMSLANAAWALEPTLISVEYVEARVSLLPLLSGTIHVNSFILHNTRIQLEKNQDGIGNWELDMFATSTGPTTASPDQTSELPPIFIDQIDIKNAVITYHDRQTSKITEFNLTELTTSVSGLEQPVAITIRADYDAFPLILDGTIGPLNTLLANNHYAIDLNGSLSTLTFTATGNVERPMQLQGGNLFFTGNLPSLRDLNTIAETDLPDIKPLALSGNLLFEQLNNISIESFKLQLGQSGLAGTFSLHTGTGTPRLTARLSSDVLDLRPFASPEQQQKPQYLFPRDELPLTGFAAVNADLTLIANQVKLAKMDLDNFQTTVKLQDGNLQTKTESGMAGGKLSASAGLRTGTNSSRLTIEIDAAGILLERLPHTQRDWFTGGPVELQLMGEGGGKSIADIAGSFNGMLLIKVGNATMPNTNVDIFGADVLMSTFNRLNPLSNSDPNSLLECAVINFDIRDGLIKIDRQIAMQTAKMSMVGSGEINLKTEMLDLGIKPYAREGLGLNLGSITGIARIGGTLANPSPEIDPKGTITAGVTAGAALATGGLSLLAQGLFNRSQNDPVPCDTAMGITTAVSTPESSTPSSATDSGGGVLDGVKRGLRGLFGN